MKIKTKFKIEFEVEFESFDNEIKDKRAISYIKKWINDRAKDNYSYIPLYIEPQVEEHTKSVKKLKVSCNG